MNRPSYLLFKKCSKCGEILHVSRFYKRKTGKYGVISECKICYKDRNKNYNDNHKEKIKEIHKKWNEKNPNFNKEYGKKWREDNKEYTKNYNKDYNIKHKEERKEYNKNYYEKHKEEIKYNNNEYRKNNPHVYFNINNKRRQREENQGKGITNEQWKEMMDFFNWTCAYSGKYLGGNDNKNIRTIDHIVALDNDGEHEIWNLVPMVRSYNISKYTNNMLEWYLQQEYFDIDRLTKIYEWRIYAYWKWKE